MYKILKAEKLAANIYLMDVEAPRVARHCEPGQFVIVKMDEKGERIPLTICDYDREAGTITIVFQPVGASTTKMTEMKAGDYFRDFTGPLGCPSEFIHEDLEELKKKKILFVGGGVGAAPVYPQVKWMKEHGIDVDVIIGSKTKDLLILEVLIIITNFYSFANSQHKKLPSADFLFSQSPGLRSSKLLQYQSVVSFLCHTDAPLIYKQKQRSSFEILDLLHIRCSGKFVHIHFLIADPADVFIWKTVHTDLYVILILQTIF